MSGVTFGGPTKCQPLAQVVIYRLYSGLPAELVELAKQCRPPDHPKWFIRPTHEYKIDITKATCGIPVALINNLIHNLN